MKFPMACMAVVLGMLLPHAAWTQVTVAISIAPPPLLLYAQPPVPGEGYIWIPGYWRWSDPERDYFWVPGTWVLAPHEGDLWTPGYWAFENAGYFWHMGYWGPQVGFYGGINYGYGYFGSGYHGGRWHQGAFRYNRAISNVDTRVVHHVYSTPGTHIRRVNRASFNGGRAGTMARPTAREHRFQSAQHTGPRTDQVEHENAAGGMPEQRANGPHRAPQVAATPKPSEFASPRVEHVRPAPGGRVQRGPAMQGKAMPVPGPATEPQRVVRPVAPWMSPRAQPAPRVEPSRPEQRAPADHPERPQQDGQPRRERRER